MDLEQIKPSVVNYISKLKKQITVSQALLFGSIVEGRARADSDVDLLIISHDFENLDEDERLRLLYRMSVGFPYDLHVSGVTPEEFHSASPLTTLGSLHQVKTVSLTE